MRTVQINGVTAALEDAGAGETIVFLHGFPLDRRMWRSQVSALGGSYRVVVPDLRGFGNSGPSTDVATMDAYADDVVALLVAIDVRGPIVLCGLSMGGYVALSLMGRHRDRVSRLILCDTRADADSDEKKAGREQMAQEVLERGTQQLVRDMPDSLMSAQSFARKPDLVAFVQEMIAAAEPPAVAAALRGMAERPDRSSLLPQIQVPTLVVCGEDDAITPVELMRGLADAIPNARFATIPGAGHLAPIENAESVNAAIRGFLDGAS